MHVPFWHVVLPLTHIGPPPQVQVPDVHPSANVASHIALPPQVHAPPVQPSASAVLQAMHIPAFVPHALTFGVAVQTFPVQQPEPHEFESHVHT